MKVNFLFLSLPQFLFWEEFSLYFSTTSKLIWRLCLFVFPLWSQVKIHSSFSPSYNKWPIFLDFQINNMLRDIVVLILIRDVWIWACFRYHFHIFTRINTKKIGGHFSISNFVSIGDFFSCMVLVPPLLELESKFFWHRKRVKMMHG